jgi:hypothetical protein
MDDIRLEQLDCLEKMGKIFIIFSPAHDPVQQPLLLAAPQPPYRILPGLAIFEGRQRLVIVEHKTQLAVHPLLYNALQGRDPPPPA